MWTGEVERDIKEEGDTRERNRERETERNTKPKTKTDKELRKIKNKY